MLDRSPLIRWELAGLVGSGGIERPITADEWTVPTSVEVVGDQLVYAGGHYGGAKVKPASGLLGQFAQLGDASPDAIKRYALRWGVLALCEHGRPFRHNPPHFDAAQPSVLLGCIPQPVPGAAGIYREPLAAWRRYARQTRALIDLAIRLHAGQHGKQDDWRACPDAWQAAAVLYSVKGGELPPEEVAGDWAAIQEWTKLGTNLAFERQVLAVTIDQWLRDGAVRPAFRWEGTAPAVRLGGGGLFGALAVQLMLVASRSDGMAICSSCGSPYVPRRRPRTGGRHYCQDCGRRAAVRDAGRDFRKKRHALPDPSTQTDM